MSFFEEIVALAAVENEDSPGDGLPPVDEGVCVRVPALDNGMFVCAGATFWAYGDVVVVRVDNGKAASFPLENLPAAFRWFTEEATDWPEADPAPPTLGGGDA